MRIGRPLAVLATAAFVFCAPSIVPTRLAPAGLDGASGGYVAADSAFAGGYAWPGHTVAAWGGFYFIVGTASVITNAAYVWHTQCRELSTHEAITSAVLPFVGIAFDVQANKCR
jgi:hypothetical protein